MKYGIYLYILSLLFVQLGSGCLAVDEEAGQPSPVVVKAEEVFALAKEFAHHSITSSDLKAKYDALADTEKVALAHQPAQPYNFVQFLAFGMASEDVLAMLKDFFAKIGPAATSAQLQVKDASAFAILLGTRPPKAEDQNALQREKALLLVHEPAFANAIFNHWSKKMEQIDILNDLLKLLSDEQKTAVVDKLQPATKEAYNKAHRRP